MGHGMIEEEVTELVKGIDIDGDGLVDYPEFLAATMKRNLSNKEEYLINAFNYFDTKKQGVITKADLVQFMGSEDQAQEVINEVDVNGDGMISFEEFVAMMDRKGFGEESESMMGSSDDVGGSFLSAQFTTTGTKAPSHLPIKETEL
uniref:EF-hand domain-containing protein n=1 Tax=Globisporangium ultimum (strain ATCC 200006 / CBS 805.95 / DAOM BR144) TaxID=431595 RepID=K3WYN1_GLOUD